MGSEQAFIKSFSMAYEDQLKDVSAKFDAQGGKCFTGKFVAMSGLSLGAKAAGLAEFVPDCLKGEQSQLVEVGVVKTKYLDFIYDVVHDDSRTKEYQSAATAAVCLWHLCKMFDNNAQFFFAKRINGIDFSVNVGFAYQKLMLMRSSRHGPGPLGVAEEVAAVEVAGAVVASAVARP